MKVWEAASAQGVEITPSVQPGYTFNGFAELAETVLHSALCDGYVAIMLHVAEDVVTSDGQTFDEVWVVEIDRAAQDSYNMEQFAYADPHETLYQAMFDDYHEAKAAWLQVLSAHVVERSV